MLTIMSTTFIESSLTGDTFIPSSYLLPGEDPYYLRNQQLEALYTPPESPAHKIRRQDQYRPVSPEEIRVLEAQGNSCTNWDAVWVKDGFNPQLVSHCVFTGYVRIGSLNRGFLRYHDYVLPVGITHSRIISCDLGDQAAIHDCRYLSHYIIGDGVILSSIDEMDTTNHAKFGEGIIKEGEDEAIRVWIDPLNEAGGRSVLPFLTITCADAYLWAVYREDTRLMDAFKRITQTSVDFRRGYYGTIGHGTVIKHCHTIKDVRIGDGAYIKGANKLKNISIQSDLREPTQIGEGVELVNGIIGYGCRVFYGCKAVRFVLGNNCNLKYGARLIHSILGDNSTVSCCEVLNNLVFPAHEQHHNNSFLIAAMILGQSNMAAGATVGSNHNSRGNDGEIIAGRGFWSGLSSTLKHNSRFASYTLVAKGNYPAELHIPLPFSLVTNSTGTTRLEVMPGYWWMYNMYALERNSWKCRIRDKRQHKVQHIETAYLAPDTVAEIIQGLQLLEAWGEEAGYPSLQAFPDQIPLLVAKRTLERSNRPVRIIKLRQGIRAYREMLLYYGVKTLTEFFALHEDRPRGTDGGYRDLLRFQAARPEAVPLPWVNLGGQLVSETKVDALREAIREGELSSWDQIHTAYDCLWQEYPFDKALNALQVLRFLQTGNAAASGTLITKEHWNGLLDEGIRIRRYIEEQVYQTKLKDYLNPFRNSTYRNSAERDAVLGHIDANPFIQEVNAESQLFFDRVEAARL